MSKTAGFVSIWPNISPELLELQCVDKLFQGPVLQPDNAAVLESCLRAKGRAKQDLGCPGWEWGAGGGEFIRDTKLEAVLEGGLGAMLTKPRISWRVVERRLDSALQGPLRAWTGTGWHR